MYISIGFILVCMFMCLSIISSEEMEISAIAHTLLYKEEI